MTFLSLIFLLMSSRVNNYFMQTIVRMGGELTLMFSVWVLWIFHLCLVSPCCFVSLNYALFALLPMIFFLQEQHFFETFKKFHPTFHFFANMEFFSLVCKYQYFKQRIHFPLTTKIFWIFMRFWISRQIFKYI